MNNKIQEIVWENLDNEIDNGYPHDWNMTPLQYVEQMIDYSGTPTLNSQQEWDIACDAVEYWRVANA